MIMMEAKSNAIKSINITCIETITQYEIDPRIKKLIAFV